VSVEALGAEDPRVKICGLTRLEDARAAEAAGADLLGFVLSRGFARTVPASHVPEFVRGTRAPRVAVLVDEPIERAVALARALHASVVQLHGTEPPETVRAVGEAGPWRVWKAVRARTVEDVRAAVLDYGPVADGLVVEGYREGAVGGSGLVLEVAPDQVRAAIPTTLDFVLAGGLTPATVREAGVRFRPDVVDVSSGVEGAPGVKDPKAMRAFVANVRGGVDGRT